MRTLITRTLIALGASALFASAAMAQSTSYGDPNFSRDTDWRSGMPHVLKVSTANVNYQFDGNPASISFTLTGGPAEVYLAVYSKDANPQYGGQPLGRGGVGNSIVRRAGLDTLIAVTAGQTFSEGKNTLVWNGKDFNGNRVAAGTYTYYLFALDNISNPTLVGPGAFTGYWSAFAIDGTQSPPVIWAPQFVESNWVVQRATIGTNYLTNPGAWQTLDVKWVNQLPAPSGPEFRDVTFYVVDPANPNIGYMGKTGWNDDALPQGVWKVKYDATNGTLLPDETWAASDGGFVTMSRRLVGGAVKAATHHRWVADDGLLYVANMDRLPPMTPQVIVLDRATGEVANIIDLTDIYFHDYDGTGQNVDTSGPYGIDVDERGVYTTGFWIQPDAYPGHFTLDGDVIWLNQDGDGILDRYFGEEATARGLDPNRDQMVNTHVKTGKYNIAILSGFNLPTWGSVVGPDGHGLFNIALPKMPVGMGTDCMWISNDSAIDGIYVGASNGTDLVQWPFDVTRAVIGSGVTAVEEVRGAPVPDDYALGNNYPNPFNASTTIGFSIPDGGRALPVTLTIYNAAGQRVSTLVADELKAGQYNATWDGTDESGRIVASGVYHYRLHAGQEFVETRQMTLLK
ncbi:MAG: FlgD immunoglobulin-like domain containing protein [Gemmatimonadota bacterium]